MTRSHKEPSRQDRFTASVRTKAARDGVHFGDVLPEAKARKLASKDNIALDRPGASVNGRSHSRNGGEWNGGQFICGPQIDDRHDSAGQKEVEIDDNSSLTLQQEDEHAHPAEMTVTIHEIARPAKAKVHRKPYEFILIPRTTAEDEYDIVSDVSTSQTVGDEGWEDVGDESDTRRRANGIT